jgi:TPR repeat protein
MSKRSKRSPNLNFNFKASGAIFPIKKTHLLQHLGIFQDNPSLLTSGEYEVQTAVPVPIFEAFVQIVSGAEPILSKENCDSFRLLSEEFRFEALLAKCCDFPLEMSGGCLAKRLSSLEERALTRERRAAKTNSLLRAILTSIEFLEGEVQRLSGAFENHEKIAFLVREVAKLDDRVSAHDRVFEREEAYRRGCECFYGFRSEEVGKQLGLSLLKGAADLGHADGQCRYGRCVLYGDGCKKDVVLAVEYLRKSAEQGNSAAQAEYGKCLLDGVGVERDVDGGIARVQSSAEGLNPLGQTFLGLCLEKGVGVEKDLGCAVEYHRFSAEQGNSTGQYNFGRCLEDGLGVAKNEARAVEWYRLSAEQGNSDGLYHFGRCLEQGLGLEKDLVRAAEYYRLSAEQGHPSGQSSFGRCLEKGIGVGCDLVRAVRYYRLSARQGNSDGLLHFGRCREKGLGFRKNMVRAAECYGLSAEQGNSEAQYHFGRCLEKGLGIEKDLVRAADYYRLAAEQGNSDGLCHFGRCLELGLGVEKDVVRAGECYKLSAAQGNSDGRAFYGRRLEENIREVNLEIARDTQFLRAVGQRPRPRRASIGDIADRLPPPPAPTRAPLTHLNGDDSSDDLSDPRRPSLSKPATGSRSPSFDTTRRESRVRRDFDRGYMDDSGSGLSSLWDPTSRLRPLPVESSRPWLPARVLSGGLDSDSSSDDLTVPLRRNRRP